MHPSQKPSFHPSAAPILQSTAPPDQTPSFRPSRKPIIETTPDITLHSTSISLPPTRKPSFQPNQTPSSRPPRKPIIETTSAASSSKLLAQLSTNNPSISNFPECEGLILPIQKEDNIPDIPTEEWVTVRRNHKWGVVERGICKREDHNFFIYQSELHSESFGNYLGAFMWILRYKYHSGAVWDRLFFNVTVDDPDLHFIQQISKQANRWGDLFLKRETWSDAVDGSGMCEKCKKWAHKCESPGFFDSEFLKILSCTMRSVLLPQWQNMPDLSGTMSIYIRCGDIFSSRYNFEEYGLLTLKSYENVLARHSNIRSIKLFSPDGTERPNKDGGPLIALCSGITDGIKNMLQESHPETAVEIIKGASILEVYRHLIFSEVAVCNPSTFCLWPTLAAKQGYLAKTTLFFSAKFEFPEDSSVQWVPDSFYLPAKNVSHEMEENYSKVVSFLKNH